jgi:tetratricopeptide (TPR) repeat protein
MKITLYFVGILSILFLFSCAATKLNVVENGTNIKEVRNRLGKESNFISHPDYLLLIYYKSGSQNCLLLKFINGKLVDQIEMPRWSINTYIGVSPSTPIRSESHYSIARRMQKQKLNHEAYLTMRDFMIRNPDSMMAVTYLAQLYVNDSLFDSALTVYDNAFSRSLKSESRISLTNNYMALLMAAKKYDRAKEIGLKAIHDYNSSKAIHGYYYNLACIYSIQNESDSAVIFLNGIIPFIAKGYTKQMIDKDPDLNNIRNNPDFQKIRSQLP